MKRHSKKEEEKEQEAKAETAEGSEETAESSGSMSDDMRFEIIEDGLRKKYLLRLNGMETMTLTGFPDADEDLAASVRMYHVTEISYRENERVTDRLTTVFNTLNIGSCSVFAVIDSDGTENDLYIGVRNNDMSAGRAQFTDALGNMLRSVLAANFPGIAAEACSKAEVREISARILRKKIISAVSVKGNFRSADTDGDFTQGPENLICAMQGKKYTGVIIAEAVPPESMGSVRNDLQEIYSKLSPYRNTRYSESPSEDSDSSSFSEMSGREKTAAIGQFMVNIAGIAIGIATMGTMGAMAGGQISSQITKLMNSLAPSGKGGGGVSTSSDSLYENRKVADLLGILDDAIRRTDEFEKYGMWNVAGYFASDEPYDAETAAVIYKALMSGEGTAHELSAVNTWKAADNRDSLEDIRQCLSRFVHPGFVYCKNDDEQSEGEYAVCINAAAGVSGKELALHLGLPRASVPGLSVTYENGSTGKKQRM